MQGNNVQSFNVHMLLSALERSSPVSLMLPVPPKLSAALTCRPGTRRTVGRECGRNSAVEAPTPYLGPLWSGLSVASSTSQGSERKL